MRHVLYLSLTVFSLIFSIVANSQILTTYSQPDYTGTSENFYEPDIVYRDIELGSNENQISSLILKNGYMLTIADIADGTGASAVYIANTGDLSVRLPAHLDNNASFIRVTPWRNPSKKGWSGNATQGTQGSQVNPSWYYNWAAGKLSEPGLEYVPMKWGNGSVGDNILLKQGSPNALGFNEPDSADQANMTVDTAISKWPQLLNSGLRLGSPAPTDGGRNWLYNFIDRADSQNLRVDFVAVHWYKGGQSANQFFQWLKDVHNRTGRMLWVTEWNNGANWTCCVPTYEEQAADVEAMLNMLEDAYFVERYAIYNWVGETRKMVDSNFNLTPAGLVYRDKVSAPAYQQTPHFHIKNRQTGDYLRPLDSSVNSPIVTAPNSWEGEWTQWSLEQNGRYFYLKNRKTGRYMRPISSADSVALESQEITSTGNRTQWIRVASSSKWFYLKNRETGKYIRPNSTADMGSGGDYNVVQQPNTWTGNWTQWQFVPVGSSNIIDGGYGAPGTM